MQIANDLRMHFDTEFVERCAKALREGDEHLNTIPRQEWDRMIGRYIGIQKPWPHSEPIHVSTPPRTAEVFRAYGDYPTIAGVNSALKAMAAHQAMQLDPTITTK